MMKLEQSIDKLESFVLKNPNSELEEIFLEIQRNYMILNDNIDKLKEEKDAAEYEVEERKKIMWSEPNYRMNLVRQIVAIG
jgi:hypothetical protein